ncbi:ATP-citrate synthase alpha chain protein 3 [Zea mays]|uniref:ATP-citrate synthase alpha chain protein 3 n=1 Tax=Zea mays TaxID=4577 RepID=A0A1D6MTP3_MAIZE|nr:ATP-citrate synthase alpha chain protein 3 [Zea mays]
MAGTAAGTGVTIDDNSGVRTTMMFWMVEKIPPEDRATCPSTATPTMESKLKASRMHIYVRRGGPNYQSGLAKMRKLGAELGVPIEVYGPEATMTGICK